MNINIPVEDSKRPLDCPLCGGSPEIRVSKTAYSGNNWMDYFVVSCSNGHGPAEEGVSQEFMLKRWDAWAVLLTPPGITYAKEARDGRRYDVRCAR